MWDFIKKNVVLDIAVIALVLAVVSTYVSFTHDWILAYGDAESHINIAKRVVDSLTPGMAQLGGIWLPLPHIFMSPLVLIDPLYRTGLAGSIVSGFAFIISSIYVYKIALVLTKQRLSSFIASLVFMLNPNVLYLQTTPMTEIVLIMFFLLSSYYFILFLEDDRNIQHLITGALFGFCASISRYEGWFLVLIQAGIVVLFYLRKRNWEKMQGMLVLFCTAAFVGIGLWLLWDYLILGDPLYFTNSQFSAKSQQMNWLARGELPAYHDIVSSFLYYIVTTVANVGSMVFILSAIGAYLYFAFSKDKQTEVILLLLSVPFIFYVVTLYMGQSVIFVPGLTPDSFEWNLFNVRYGVVMVPAIAIFFGYLFYKSKNIFRYIIMGVFVLQTYYFVSGAVPVISQQDGVTGLSHAKRPDAEGWMKKNYTSGLVLLDDYARTISIVRSDIPMKNIIYVGNKPYWAESLKEPEKHAKWIVMQKDDDVWDHLNDDKVTQARLYKYFKKVYTSNTILIFQRNDTKISQK